MEQNLYKVIEKISGGGFGEIFKVKSLKTDEYLALKRIKYRGNFNDQTYIKNEILSLSLLRHENIMAYHDVIYKSGEVNILMEYAANGNLEEYVCSHNKLENTTIFGIYLQILKAVDFCHHNFIAHRDITPSNILLTPDMTIKVADFGLSMKCKTSDGTSLLCYDFLGNRLYLAPEVIREFIHDAMFADLWTLGVLLYFVMFSCVPFSGDDEDILIQQQTIRNSLITSEFVVSPFYINTVLDLLKIIPTERLKVSTVLHFWQAEYSKLGV